MDTVGALTLAWGALHYLRFGGEYDDEEYAAILGGIKGGLESAVGRDEAVRRIVEAGKLVPDQQTQVAGAEGSTESFPDLDPLGYLVMQVLVSRGQSGSETWSFPRYYARTLDRLQERGWISWKQSSATSACLAWLTELGWRRGLSTSRPDSSD